MHANMCVCVCVGSLVSTKVCISAVHNNSTTNLIHLIIYYYIETTTTKKRIILDGDCLNWRETRRQCEVKSK